MNDETMTSGASGAVTTGDRRAEIAAHTPGPWHHSRPSGAVKTESKKLVASVFGDNKGCIEDGRQIANATLIAAAPDMLAALKWAAKELQRGKPRYPIEKNIIAVIAKATGGTNTSGEAAEQSEAVVP